MAGERQEVDRVVAYRRGLLSRYRESLRIHPGDDISLKLLVGSVVEDAVNLGWHQDDDPTEDLTIYKPSRDIERLLQYGGFTYKPLPREVTTPGGDNAIFTPNEGFIFEQLITHPEIVMPYFQLLPQGGYEIDLMRNLKTHMHFVRRKLGDTLIQRKPRTFRYINSIFSTGYIFAVRSS